MRILRMMAATQLPSGRLSEVAWSVHASGAPCSEWAILSSGGRTRSPSSGVRTVGSTCSFWAMVAERSTASLWRLRSTSAWTSAWWRWCSRLSHTTSSSLRRSGQEWRLSSRNWPRPRRPSHPTRIGTDKSRSKRRGGCRQKKFFRRQSPLLWQSICHNRGDGEFLHKKFIIQNTFYYERCFVFLGLY